MARTYTLRALTDDHGNPLAEVWCRAFNVSTGALVETKYTDATGVCTFTTLPEDANVNICCVQGNLVKWFYNIFAAAQDVLYASITAQHISLVGEWYDKAGVEIDADYGINIYGATNALTTRATKTGTIQCYVGSDGAIYAGAGKVYMNSTGLHIDCTGGTALLDIKYGGNACNIWVDSGGITHVFSGGGVLYLDGNGGVKIPNNCLPNSATSYNLGSSSLRWRYVYGDPILSTIGGAIEGSLIMAGGVDGTLYVYRSGGWRINTA